MWERYVKAERDRQRIEEAGLKEVLDQLHVRMTAGGYNYLVVHRYEKTAVHFALWACGERLQASQLTDAVLDKFLARHLPNCRCELVSVRARGNVQAVLGHIRSILDSNQYRPSQKKQSDVDREVREFDDYMRTVAGLKETTRGNNRYHAGHLLQQWFGEAAVDYSRFTAPALLRYVSGRAVGFKPSSVKALCVGLRSYLRFLQLQGKCDRALILCIQGPANPRLATLPKVLTNFEIERFLATFNVRTAVGIRNYAIARCIADLGLRPLEVATLRLEDLDWRKATIRIAGDKSRRGDQLPLMESTGKAIANYLRDSRPKTSERLLFVHIHAPFGQGISRQMVCTVIRNAIERAGIKIAPKGPRILRHTAATRLLRHGASMKEVADILRHRSIDTTAIYAKVDMPRLATIATPWPKGGRG